MEKYYKEKHLQATKYKIENVIRQQDFLLRNKWKALGVVIAISLWAPIYASRDYISQGESIMEESGYGYTTLVLLTAIVCVVLCFLYHFSSKYQDNRKLKELRALEQ